MASTRVATESFRRYWEDVRRVAARRFVCVTGPEGSVLREPFCVWAGIDADEYELIMKAMRSLGTHPTLPFDLVDKVMVAAGMEWAVTSLYLVPSRAPAADTPANVRRERAQQRRLTIARLWREGMTLQQIAWELGDPATVGSVGVSMARMRADGWDLPYRRADLDAAADRPLASKQAA